MPTGWLISDFVVNNCTHLQPSTQLQYARTLRTIVRKVGHPEMPLLDMTIAGLQVRANKAPIRQAPPATPEQMRALHAAAWEHDPTGRLAMTIWLCWKTTSRWADIYGLRKRNFLCFDEDRQQIVIEWGDLKTNRKQRYRSCGFTVVQEERHLLTIGLLRRLVNRLHRDERLAPMTTRQFARFLRGCEQTRNLSAHSIKRGSLDHLVEKAADGLFEPRLIPLLAKHKDELHEFPPSTLRYISRKIALARMLGTQNATRLL